MNRKKIITIVCISLAVVCSIAAGVYFGYYVGKKSIRTAEKQEISEPVCEMSDFTLFDTAVDQYATTEGFGAPYLKKCFEMPEADAQDLVSHPENWLCFQAYFTIKNTDISELSIFSVTCPDNGEKGVYIFTGTTGVYTIPKKGSYVLCVPVLYKSNELSTDDARDMLNVLDVNIRYGAHFDPDDCVNYSVPVSLK
ncbi:MAG: hypothetical protein IJ050_07065 [Clostridia bacterium]|nr:hypothetical protein [Clostridia bacterium]